MSVSTNPNVLSIKHMAFGVKDAKVALEAYSKFLDVPTDTAIIDYPKSKNRVALFELGGIEYQLCQSMEEGGRFNTWMKQRGGAEGLHHICYAVDDIDKALEHAKAQGADLRICQACGVYGSHAHPEGYVAFLDNDAGGIEIEFMQVYTADELEKYKAVKGI